MNRWAQHSALVRRLLLVGTVLGSLTALVLAGTQGTAAADTRSIRARQPTLHVIPFPGTPDASPHTQIIFSSLAPSDLAADPVVVGSTSGAHHGHLSLLPDGAGTVFSPAQPFIPGEKVTVNALLNSPQAGTHSGDPNSTDLNYSFTIALPAPPHITHALRHTSRLPPSLLQAFYSLPGVTPPAVHVSTGPAPGRDDILMAPLHVLMILNRSGHLVWVRNLGRNFGSNLEVQRYRDRPVLTWWQGNVFEGHGVDGRDVILDRHYRRIAVLRGGWGDSSDLHEFQLTSRGTALIDDYVPVHADLTSVGGASNAVLLDCVVQELDVRTGKVLWEWHALGHLPLPDSRAHPPASGPYDAFHMNSIQQLPGHRLLISMRNTWAVYEIDERTGRVIWTLGGKNSSFKMGRATNFEWQHDAHLYGHGLLTVFDDGAVPQEEPQSSAKELRLSVAAGTVSLVHRYVHSPPLLTGFEGNTELLPDHDMFVSWGDLPAFSEYTRGGQQVFNASLPLGINTYRAYRFAWTGEPRTRPALAVSRRPGGGLSVYSSWNGATQVASWRVLGGRGRHSVKPVRARRRTSFETRITLSGRPRFIAVQALGVHGHVLATSRTVPTGRA